MTLFGIVGYIVIFIIVTTMADAFIQHRQELERRDRGPK